MEAMRLVSLAALSFCFLNIFPALAFAEGAVIGAPCPGQTGMTKLSDDNMDILACLPETPGGREVWQPMSFCQVVVNNNTYNNNTYPTYTTTTNNPTDGGSSGQVTGSCEVVTSTRSNPNRPGSNYNVDVISEPSLAFSGVGCNQSSYRQARSCVDAALPNFVCTKVSSRTAVGGSADSLIFDIDICQCNQSN